MAAHIFLMALEGRSETVDLVSSQSVLASAEADGRDLIKVGCRRGGCGLCKVKILKGKYSSRKMSRAHVSELEEAEGFALACRVIPEGDLLVQAQSDNINEHSSNNKN
jgi:ferredoxin